ncbi:MAG: M20/M25/M40 family metallo-hydrolase [Bacteroidales bacterium]|nr:M20/M25/M40 family metallo-hydrolase [Bacteroidales bacterium]
MKSIRVIICLIALSLSVSPAFCQEKVIREVLETGRTDNHTMQHADYLSNRIGGRIIGSAALEEAEKWVASQFRSWGLEVMVQEVGEINVGFERGPWSGRMLSEDGMVLHFGTPSYTAGTKGPQKGHVVIAPRSINEFNRVKGKLKGAWVLVDEVSAGWPIDWREQTDTLFFNEIVEAGALGFIQKANMPITLLYDRKHCFKITPDNLPSVCDIKLDPHQYDIIRQKVVDKKDFLLEFDIRNHFRVGPVKYHNVIGIIRGKKHPDEYVMLGGHLDSYDSATGAVDDGNGSSVVMEAARLLAESGAKPDRSIMLCLWTGEEFGLLGSRYFVENNTVPYDKISNYFNRDGGPTLATSITVPPAMYEDFLKVCKPIEDYVQDAHFTVNERKGDPRPRPKNAGGSDHAYFALNGIPAISFGESDPFGYNFDYREIWHTENDRYNKLIPEYMEPSAVISAVVAYGLANLNHLLSREGLYSE